MGIGATGRLISVFLLICGLSLMAACSYRSQIDDPVTWKLTWYAYIDGSDIRQECRAGGPRHYRFVYNADYEKHIRSYTLIDDGKGGAYLISRAIEGSGIDVRAFSLSDPFAVGGAWVRSEKHLAPEEVSGFIEALSQSGAFEPANLGLRLYSNQYYWVAALCDGGKFYFNAWLYPSPSFARLTFPDLLFATDETKVGVPPPLRVPAAARLGGDRRGEKPNAVFELRVAADGFEGGPLF